jgi:flagellar biosynthetic protein FlhB
MSEQSDAERTESPTQKRIEDARKKGQVPRSRDLTAAAVTLAGGLGMYGLGRFVGTGLLQMMRSGLTLAGPEALEPDRMQFALVAAASQSALALAPLFGLLVAAATLAPLVLGGWNFSLEALQPKWERLDPVAGLQRVFSLKGVVELGKSLARFLVVALVAIALLRHQFQEFAELSAQPLGVGIVHAMQMAGAAFLTLGCALVAIAMVDVPIVLWQHHRSLRMTREEIREESKESDGNPEVKGRIRRTQQQLARRRMMEQVPTADVVVTNPTHYAVALRYDDTRMRAPVVVAKGADLVAARIRELATEHGVPLVEAPPLARALHAGCELGDEIPAQLYAVVAQLLTYVYQLKAARRRGAGDPTPPRFEDVEVPGQNGTGVRS